MMPVSYYDTTHGSCATATSIYPNLTYPSLTLPQLEKGLFGLSGHKRWTGKVEKRGGLLMMGEVSGRNFTELYLWLV